MPAMPMPSRVRVAGSGTAEALGAENDARKAVSRPKPVLSHALDVNWPKLLPLLSQTMLPPAYVSLSKDQEAVPVCPSKKFEALRKATYCCPATSPTPPVL